MKEAQQKEAERKETERLEAQQKAELLEAERKETQRLEAEKRQQIESQAPKLVAPVQNKQAVASAEEVNQPSDSGCKHYFGYLGQREKGEEIPTECLECPKALDCMLQHYKSKESVSEIKKWYPTNADPQAV